MRRTAVFAVAALVVAACRESTPVPPAAPAPDAAAHVERLAKACAKVASCAHSHDPPRMRDPSACVDWAVVRGRPEDQLAYAHCVDAAKGCSAIDACAGDRIGDPVAAAYCRAHPGEQAACEGTRLVTCSEDDAAESTSVDCAAMQATCGDIHAAGGLIVRACTSATLCPAGAPEARCDGANAIVTCREGAVERTACAAGVRCEEHRGTDGVQGAICETKDHAHCKDVGKSRCDGGRLVQCLAHGQLGEERVIDCDAMGLACYASGARPVCALPGTRACEAGAPRCEGNTLTFCAAGKPMRIPCAELGFARCDPDGHGLEASCAAAARVSDATP